MSFLTRLKGFFSSSRETQTKKVPILGVEGSGKSSLIVTLGQFISQHKMGVVAMAESGSSLFGHYLRYVMAGEPFPATTRWDKFALHVERVPEPDGGHTLVDLVISSEDIPGVDFRHLVDELRENPNLAGGDGKRASELVGRFTDLLSKCDGFIFIIDLMRDSQIGSSPTKEQIWAAFGDQIQPIMTGIQVAMKMNAAMAFKPIFFVFSKPDLHGLTQDEIKENFERCMAVPLAQLRKKLINVRHYNVQCAGWGMDSELQKLGIDVLLSDLVHAMGAASEEA